jgi:hypothetical protein
VAKQLYWVLVPLAEATNILQSSDPGNVSSIYPVLAIVKARMDKDTAVEMWDSPDDRKNQKEWIEVEESKLELHVKSFREQVRKEIHTVFSSWTAEQWELVQYAAILNPLYKNLKFLAKKEKRELYTDFLEQCLRFTEERALQNDTAATERKSDLPAKRQKKLALGDRTYFMNSIAYEDSSAEESDETSSSSLCERIKAELEFYIKEKISQTEGEEFRVLDWWAKNQSKYPHLAEMARVYLSAFASSADVERLFSNAGQILTKLRTSMKPAKMEQVLVCHSNPDLTAKAKPAFSKKQRASRLKSKATCISDESDLGDDS